MAFLDTNALAFWHSLIIPCPTQESDAIVWRILWNMAMARLIFFSAVCVAFSRRQVEEASSVSLVEDASNTAIVFMDELDDMDDMDEEMITSVPVTPRRDPHDPRYELLGLDSSMMEITETTNETETCGTKGKPSYEITGKLGQGNWGAVYKVRTKTGRKYQYFALKVPLAANPQAAAENVKEANIMGAVHCMGVLPLVEKAPCVAQNGQLSTAFVTKLMPGDLQKWSEQASQSKKNKCIEKISNEIYSGLKCFHKAGYVHGDIKPDNILYSSIDDQGCPEDIILADFGLTTKVGELNTKFDHKWWKISFHIPETMFDGVKDPLGLTETARLKNGGTVPVVTMKPVLDLCSFAFLLRRLVPGIVSLVLQEKLGKGACGKMGPGRQWSLP